MFPDKPVIGLLILYVVYQVILSSELDNTQLSKTNKKTQVIWFSKILTFEILFQFKRRIFIKVL